MEFFYAVFFMQSSFKNVDRPIALGGCKACCLECIELWAAADSGTDNVLPAVCLVPDHHRWLPCLCLMSCPLCLLIVCRTDHAIVTVWVLGVTKSMPCSRAFPAIAEPTRQKRSLTGHALMQLCRPGGPLEVHVWRRRGEKGEDDEIFLPQTTMIVCLVLLSSACTSPRLTTAICDQQVCLTGMTHVLLPTNPAHGFQVIARE
jgi:hypothetical protein